jgi:hypothetical protein
MKSKLGRKSQRVSSSCTLLPSTPVYLVPGKAQVEALVVVGVPRDRVFVPGQWEDYLAACDRPEQHHHSSPQA